MRGRKGNVQEVSLRRNGKGANGKKTVGRKMREENEPVREEEVCVCNTVGEKRGSVEEAVW